MKKLLCTMLCFLIFSNFCVVSAYDVSAKAAVVIDAVTGEILYSYNCNSRMPMASTTKIMTALLLCELCEDLTETVTVTQEMVAVEGSSMGLLAGDTVSYHDLLYGIMLASGNDAANTVAISLCGSIENFVSLMNDRAKNMGLVDTNFVTPSGLDAEGHYTTAYELALIAKVALANTDFASAAESKSARLCYGNPPYYRTLTNHNKLLKTYDDVVGVKTGYTQKSGRCLVSASKSDGKFVIAVTLNDGNDWQDHRYLLDLGLSLIETKLFSPPQDFFIKTVDGKTVKVNVPSAEIGITDNTVVTYGIYVPDILYSPIKSGDTVGYVNYFCNGTKVCTKPITVEKTINQNGNSITCFLEIFKSIFMHF